MHTLIAFLLTAAVVAPTQTAPESPPNVAVPFVSVEMTVQPAVVFNRFGKERRPVFAFDAKISSPELSGDFGPLSLLVAPGQRHAQVFASGRFRFHCNVEVDEERPIAHWDLLVEYDGVVVNRQATTLLLEPAEMKPQFIPAYPE